MRDGMEAQRYHLLVMIEGLQRRGCDEGQIAAMVERELGPQPSAVGSRRRRRRAGLFGLGGEREAA
jgi:hypothetical protein